MTDFHPSAATDPTTEQQPAHAEQQVWVFRAITGLVTISFLWLAWRVRNNGITPMLLVPLVLGGGIATLRLPRVSDAVNALENWLRGGAQRAETRQRKFARLIQRPFFATCCALWRWTAPLPDPHLRAGTRLMALIFLCGAVVMLLVAAAYLVIAIVAVLAMLALFIWLLSVWAGSGSSGSKSRITRYTTDWLGRQKEEHFDMSSNKVGESRASSDWLGRPKIVHTDAEGNVAGESKPNADWLGNPKTVHTDADGNLTGESMPDADWLGRPKVVHTDVNGDVVGESRDEADLLGRPQTVRYDK